MWAHWTRNRHGFCRANRRGETPLDLARSLDTEAKTCRLVKLLEAKQVDPLNAPRAQISLETFAVMIFYLLKNK